MCDENARTQLSTLETSTKASTDIDTETSSSSGTDADDKPVNLCDVPHGFMQRKTQDDEELENIRLQAQTALLEAVSTGKLHDAFAESTKSAKTAQQFTGPQPQDKSSRPASDRATPNDLEDMRLEMRQLFTDAATNGQLEAAFCKATQRQQATKEDNLRTSCKRILLTAAFDGRLDQALAAKAVSKPSKNELAAASLEENQRSVSEASAGNKMSVEAFRAKLRAILSTAAVDGRLETAVEEVRTEKEPLLERLRLKAKQVFKDTVKNGKLAEALSQARETKEARQNDLRQQVKDSLVNAASDGTFRRAVAENHQEQQLENLRAQACLTLLQALKQGTLADTMALVKQEHQQTKAASIEPMRLRLKQKFVDVASDGRLDSIMRNVRKQEVQVNEQTSESCSSMENLRLRLRGEFLKAASNGKLDTAMKEASENEELEDLRLQARETLLKGLQDGRLKKALTLAEQETSELNTLRLQAKQTFMAAAQNGRLEDLLLQSQEKQSSVEDLRVKAKDLLLNVVDDRRLEQACKVAREQRAPENLEALRRDIKEVLVSSLNSGALQAVLERQRTCATPSDAARAQIRQTLTTAASDGRLEAVLSEVKSEKPQPPLESVLETMRCQIRETLTAAAFDGRLDATFSQVSKEEPPCEDLRAQARQALIQGALSGKLSKSLSEAAPAQKDASSVLAMRAEMRKVLIAASQDGTLERSIVEVKQETKKGLTSEELRLRARDREAISGNCLGRVLEDVKRDSESFPGELPRDELRKKAREIFTKAAGNDQLREVFANSDNAQEAPAMKADDLRFFVDGRLQTTIQEELPSDPLTLAEAREAFAKAALVSRPSMLTDIRETLAAAAADGRLSKALAEVKEAGAFAEMQDVRKQAREAFLQASASGKLSQALRESVGCSVPTTPYQEVNRNLQLDALTAKLRSTLEKGAQDGSLGQALREVMLPKAPTVSGVESVAAKFRRTFSGAIADGKFSAAIKEANLETVEELRCKAKNLLESAEKDGRLAAALSQIIVPPTQPCEESPLDTERHAPTPEPEAKSAPAKPTSAKCSARPLRQFARAQSTKPSTPAAPIELEEPDSAHTILTCKSLRNRRIIGAVTRGPAEDPEPTIEMPASPPGRRSKVNAFRRDVNEASSMALDSDEEDWTTEDTAHLRVQPGSKLKSASGKISPTAPTSGISALAMDLGQEVPIPSYRALISAKSARTSQSWGAPHGKMQKNSPQTFSKLPPVHTSSSSPTGKVRLRKPGERRRRSSSITWTVHLGESAVQWDLSRAVC